MYVKVYTTKCGQSSVLSNIINCQYYLTTRLYKPHILAV